MYAFLGIALVTQNFINPSIDIIKQKGVLSSDSMNATLLAMTNSAAESFIIMNSIFFGVSDIGMSTVVQQTAFYALIIQGLFYLIAEPGTRVDWWIITRDTIFILVYGTVLTLFLWGNDISDWKGIIMFVLYIVHILLMKYNHIYEVAIKKSVARTMEIKELKKLAKRDITHFHRNLNSRGLSIEMLNKVPYRVEENYIVFDPLNKKKIKKISCVKFREGSNLTQISKLNMTDKVKIILKKSVIKILIKIQAFKALEKINRDKKAKVKQTRYLKL